MAKHWCSCMNVTIDFEEDAKVPGPPKDMPDMFKLIYRGQTILKKVHIKYMHVISEKRETNGYTSMHCGLCNSVPFIMKGFTGRYKGCPILYSRYVVTERDREVLKGCATYSPALDICFIAAVNYQVTVLEPTTEAAQKNISRIDHRLDRYVKDAEKAMEDRIMKYAKEQRNGFQALLLQSSKDRDKLFCYGAQGAAPRKYPSRFKVALLPKEKLAEAPAQEGSDFDPFDTDDSDFERGVDSEDEKEKEREATRIRRFIGKKPVSDDELELEEGATGGIEMEAKGRDRLPSITASAPKDFPKPRPPAKERVLEKYNEDGTVDIGASIALLHKATCCSDGTEIFGSLPQRPVQDFMHLYTDRPQYTEWPQ